MTKEHWGSSGFANTGLDVQLKQHGLQIVLVEMLANTCVETTAKFGVELGYHVTLVCDATAVFSTEAMPRARDQRPDLCPCDPYRERALRGPIEDRIAAEQAAGSDGPRRRAARQLCGYYRGAVSSVGRAVRVTPPEGENVHAMR